LSAPADGRRVVEERAPEARVRRSIFSIEEASWAVARRQIEHRQDDAAYGILGKWDLVSNTCRRHGDACPARLALRPGTIAGWDGYLQCFKEIGAFHRPQASERVRDLQQQVIVMSTMSGACQVRQAGVVRDDVDLGVKDGKVIDIVPFYSTPQTICDAAAGCMAMSKVHVHATLKVRIGGYERFCEAMAKQVPSSKATWNMLMRSHPAAKSTNVIHTGSCPTPTASSMATVKCASGRSSRNSRGDQDVLKARDRHHGAQDAYSPRVQRVGAQHVHGFLNAQRRVEGRRDLPPALTPPP